jgi:hypothetical protein
VASRMKRDPRRLGLLWRPTPSPGALNTQTCSINDAGRALSSLCGGACFGERADDPLHCGRIDAKLLGNLSDTGRPG